MISSVSLRNFKCFTEATLELRPLTLLAGMNGMGKSSIIQALLLLRQSFQQGLLPSRGLALSGDLAQIGTSGDALCKGADSDELALGVQFESNPSAEFVFRYEGPFQNVMKIVRSTGDMKHSVLCTDSFFYLMAERLGPRVSYPTSDYSVRQHRQLGKQGEYAVQYIHQFYREEIDGTHRLHSLAPSRGLKDQIEAWMGEISPGVRFSFNEQFGMDVVTPTVSFASETLSEDFRTTNTGFGIMYALPVVTALLAAKPDALVLLENPEAHLHPRGQVKIAELAARAVASGVQVLIETHSDHILNGVRIAVHQDLLPPEKIQFHYFARVPGGPYVRTRISSPKIDAKGRFDVWPDGFFDETDRSLEILLTPKPTKTDD
ncbi:MAG TPA: DUF3696 domain-containing protein [Candidatus Angelobacter sp.]|jgi:predicted ATPase|nr:DUF3696 domain-containing protein [Candidatus Angelobacter sp.]